MVFPNEYNVKQVAAGDSKSCVICYKPSSTVLLSSNKADFFYVCPVHLQDDHFAVPVKPENYESLLKLKTELGLKVETLERQLEENKPYIWSKLSTYVMPGSGGKKDDKNNKDDDKKDDTKDVKSSNKYESIQTELRTVKKDLADTNTLIENFKFKTYQLDQNIYRSRVQQQVKAKQNKVIAQKIQLDPTFFPSVPTNKIG